MSTDSSEDLGTTTASTSATPSTPSTNAKGNGQTVITNGNDGDSVFLELPTAIPTTPVNGPGPLREELPLPVRYTLFLAQECPPMSSFLLWIFRMQKCAQGCCLRKLLMCHVVQALAWHPKQLWNPAPRLWPQLPRRRLLVRDFAPRGTRRASCWASWSAQTQAKGALTQVQRKQPITTDQPSHDTPSPPQRIILRVRCVAMKYSLAVDRRGADGNRQQRHLRALPQTR